MKAHDYTAIDQYLQGALNETERIAFEEQLEQDADLAESLSIRKEMNHFLGKREMRNKIKSQTEALGKIYFKKNKVIPLWRRRPFMVAVVAAMVIGLILAWPWLFPPSLYEQFAQHQELALQEKSLEGSYDPVQIQADFNSGNFAEAHAGLEAYLQLHPDDTRVLLPKGIAALELNLYDEAVSIFEPIFQGNTAFKSTAAWYLALTAIKQGNPDGARPYLESIPEGSFWWEKAQQLLKKL